LLGDYGTDINSTVISPIYNSYCASDNIYGDYDGDQLPDIVMARITAKTRAASGNGIQIPELRTKPTNKRLVLQTIPYSAWLANGTLVPDMLRNRRGFGRMPWVKIPSASMQYIQALRDHPGRRPPIPALLSAISAQADWAISPTILQPWEDGPVVLQRV
jgi:hypothetical protein